MKLKLPCKHNSHPHSCNMNINMYMLLCKLTNEKPFTNFRPNAYLKSFNFHATFKNISYSCKLRYTSVHTTLQLHSCTYVFIYASVTMFQIHG